jgi:thiol-disulfide isomerase/thioredoxin
VKTTTNNPAVARKTRSLLVALISFWLFACTNHAELEGPAPSVALKTLSGQAIEVQNAGKPMLVNFWSTSCGICLTEMPELAALYNDYQSKGFEMVMVAAPYDPPNVVLEMAEKESWAFPVALDIDGAVDAAFGDIKGTPTRFLINREGQLVARMAGRANIEKLRQQMDQLL